MAELSIKVKIANRVYPLKIKASEEEGVRKAAEAINHSIAELEQLYDVKDKQDLLAMVAIKIASKNFSLEENSIHVNANIKEDLMKVEKIFDQYL